MHYLDRRVVPPPKCLASPRVDTFADLDKNEKAEIRERLLEMQQQRCAYCERPSSGHQDGHIEHFRDQAGQAIHGTHNMEWSNLFWSCNDESSCGKHKDQCRKQSGPQARVDPDLLIDPSTDDPHTYLGFGTDGTVAPLFGLVPPAASRAAETVRAFNLDNPFLRRMRKKAVERHVEFLKWLVAAGSETVRAYADTEIAAIGGLPFESPIRQLLGRFR